MRELKMTVALVALLGGSVLWPVTSGVAQDATPLEDAISAQQADTLAAAEAEAEAPVLLTEEELDDLVAPVALYPDALLAQVLVAATFPLQVAKADQLIAASADMDEDELSASLERQEFDPSVLVLMSGFPTVVSRMAEDLVWTEQLGQAMVAQDADVLAAVQRMRAEAEAQGNLTSNAAQVIEKDEDQISIKPADPNVVYVPSYDPQTVYTTATPVAPYIAPQTSTNPIGNPLVAGALAFGGALLVQELFDDGDSNNNNKGDWNDYWNDSGRPIDWRDRQVYARPPLYQTPGGQSWRSERDLYWDHRANRWQRNDAQAARAYQTKREETLKAMLHDRNQQVERMRAAAREQRLEEADRRQQIVDRRQKAAAEAARKDRAAAEVRRDDRAKAERAEARQKAAAKDAAAAEKDRRAKAAAAAERKDERAKAAKAADRTAAEKAAAQKKRQDAAKAASKQQQAADTAAEKKRKAAAQAKRQDQAKAAAAADRKKAAAQQAKRDDKAQAAAAAKKQQQNQAKAAAQQEKKAAQKQRTAQKNAQKCKNDPDAKDCKTGN